VPIAAAWLFLFLIASFPSAAQTGANDAERAKNEEAALAMWPEAADSQSIMGQEMRRLMDEYEARKDPRLESVTAPMWIASQAAANTERRRTDTESQQSAMRLYPDLAVLDSPLNQLFRETYARYKEVKPEYFSDPRWPLKLAQQCALQLAAQKAVGASGDRTSRLTASAGITDTAAIAPAEAKASPTRRWLVITLLIVAGITLAFLIIRRSLRAHRGAAGEEDGSAI
jgi:hypothetical protein